MTAKEMFEKLGYILSIYNNFSKTPIEITYINKIENDKYIIFSLVRKQISVSPYLDITIKKLQAINKQVEELGWNK